MHNTITLLLLTVAVFLLAVTHATGIDATLDKRSGSHAKNDNSLNKRAAFGSRHRQVRRNRREKRQILPNNTLLKALNLDPNGPFIDLLTTKYYFGNRQDNTDSVNGGLLGGGPQSP